MILKIAVVCLYAVFIFLSAFFSSCEITSGPPCQPLGLCMPLFCDRTIPELSPKTSPGPPTAWPPRRARTALPKCSAPATVHSTRRTRSGAAIPIPATSSVTSLGPSATNNPAAFRPFLSPSERIVCISALVNIFIIDYANMPESYRTD